MSKPPHLHRGRKWGGPAKDAIVFKYERKVAGGKWEPVEWPDMKMALKEQACKRVRAGGTEKSHYGTEYRLAKPRG